MKVTVSVELTFNVTDETTARELARHAVESRGLDVTRVAVSKPKGEGKAWNPKAGKPGAPVVANGRRFQVWDESPFGGVWVVPEERRPDDAPVYMYRGGSVEPYHGDGKACRTTYSYDSAYKRTEHACEHPSHARAAVA